MEVYLIRHTAPFIERGICYGQSDIALQIPYLEQFSKIVQYVGHENAVIYSSPLKRCSVLADHFKVNNDNSPAIITDDRLMEMNFGDWEMKKWDDIHIDSLNKWMADFVNEKVPNGESFSELDARVSHFVENELLKSKKKTAIIITHAGVIRSILCKAMNMELKDAFKNQVEYGSIGIVEINNVSTKLKMFNNIDYL